MSLLITICARGGSKGIPGKNIRPVNGKPLIAYSIAAAQNFAVGHDADIALSTDSNEIAEVAAAYGLTSGYRRNAALSSDKAGKKETIADLVQYEEKKRGKRYDYILDLDVTSPLRTAKDLEQAFSMFKADTNALDLFSVNPANRNPYFNMVEQKADGYYTLVKQGEFVTRQSAPAVYDLNASFYFYRREYFETDATVINDRSLVYVMDHICFDLDHPLDFEFMEYLLSHNKTGFEL